LYCDPRTKGSLTIPSSNSRQCHVGIAVNECITPGVKVWSCYGCFYLELEAGGNMAIKNKQGQSVSYTTTPGGVKACLNVDGNFELFNASNSVIWQTGTSGNPGAYIEVQYDALLAVWAGGKSIYTTGVRENCV
jgi:hypothetical protein